MNKFIANSTAGYPLGISTQQKCLMVPSGQYAGRTAVVYSSSSANISLVFADAPYSVFSSPANVVTDADDSPFDAKINSDGDIYITYSETTTNNLKFVKLTFAGGSWSVGTPATVYSGGGSFYPCLCKITTGPLWISYSRLSGGDYYLNVKTSSAEGSDWGTISDPGDTLTSGATSLYSQILESNEYQFIFYSEGGSKIAYNSKSIGAAFWGSEVVLATVGGYDENLSAGTSTDGRLGVSYNSSAGLKFREYTGSSWMAEMTVDTNQATLPQVMYRGGDAYVVFALDQGSNMNHVLYSKKELISFATPLAIDSRKSNLKKLLVYNASSGTYEDKTDEATSVDVADVQHSSSSAMLDNTDDAVFIGMDEPFNYLHLILSTAGIGGEVVWKYWDGQIWKSVEPQSGVYNLTSSPHDLLLWTDYNSIPADWQKKSISDNSCYWISVTVTTPFTTAPVGSRVNSITNLNAISLQV